MADDPTRFQQVSDPQPITFLSWNLALLATSAQAPASWTVEHAELAVRDLVLAVEPDLVLFQELPGLCPYVETHDLVRSNPRTHSGHLGVLVSNDLLDRWGRPSHVVVPGCGLLVTFDDPAPPITIACVHLTSGRAGAGERLEQLATVVDAAPTPALAVIGDLNTRVAEIDPIVDAGFAAPVPPRATWDSRRNRFNARGGEFVAYFTRALSLGPVAIGDQVVHDEPLEVDGHRFWLSDHFALGGSINALG